MVLVVRNYLGGFGCAVCKGVKVLEQHLQKRRLLTRERHETPYRLAAPMSGRNEPSSSDAGTQSRPIQKYLNYLNLNQSTEIKGTHCKAVCTSRWRFIVCSGEKLKFPRSSPKVPQQEAMKSTRVHLDCGVLITQQSQRTSQLTSQLLNWKEFHDAALSYRSKMLRDKCDMYNYGTFKRSNQIKKKKQPPSLIYLRTVKTWRLQIRQEGGGGLGEARIKTSQKNEKSIEQSSIQ